MSSKVDIINMALTNINVPRIAALTDTSSQARTMVALYDQVRRAVLADADWRFASETVELAQLDEEDVEWAYVYQLPSDIMRPIRLVNPYGYTDPEYEIRGNKLYCDLDSEVYLKYVTDFETTTQFPAMFISAFAYRLGAEAAPSLSARAATTANLWNLYQVEIDKAKAANANIGKKDRRRFRRYVTAGH